MTNAMSILLVGSCESHDWTSDQPFETDGKSNVHYCEDPANVLESVVMENPDLCLIGSVGSETLDLIKTFADAREAGVRIPIVPILREDQLVHRDFLIASGATTPILDDPSLPNAISLVTDHANDRRAADQKHREEKETLIKQLLDMRDAQERLNDQSIKLVELAEELEESKTELEQLNSEKNKLFSIIAHDLRAPFNAILGYTETMVHLGESLDADRLRNYAGTTHEAAQSVFKLMETMLDWARMQMDRVEPNIKPVELSPLLKATTDVYGKIAREKGIRLSADFPKIRASCDAGMVDTVLRNLLNNAIKFTRSGGRVDVGIRESATFDPHHLEIYVSDTGLGMSPERVSKCFQMSEDIKTPGTNGEAGTGLGLLLCKDLVQKNHGKISVTSELGVGTEFVFTLPRLDRTPVRPTMHDDESLSYSLH